VPESLHAGALGIDVAPRQLHQDAVVALARDDRLLQIRGRGCLITSHRAVPLLARARRLLGFAQRERAQPSPSPARSRRASPRQLLELRRAAPADLQHGAAGDLPLRGGFRLLALVAAIASSRRWLTCSRSTESMPVDPALQIEASCTPEIRQPAVPLATRSPEPGSGIAMKTINAEIASTRVLARADSCPAILPPSLRVPAQGGSSGSLGERAVALSVHQCLQRIGLARISSGEQSCAEVVAGCEPCLEAAGSGLPERGTSGARQQASQAARTSQWQWAELIVRRFRVCSAGAQPLRRCSRKPRCGSTWQGLRQIPGICGSRTAVWKAHATAA